MLFYLSFIQVHVMPLSYRRGLHRRLIKLIHRANVKRAFVTSATVAFILFVIFSKSCSLSVDYYVMLWMVLLQGR